ncbi:MAG: nucleotidyltransferase domain-containing protein, partial [Acidobacteria bacterium]|nr:nucleotidyltransferase domain-containing protein [Acidobacteriota bacterium]
MKATQPELLEEAVRRLKAEFQPEEIYVFGSYVWGTPGENSDIDL